MDVDPGAVGWQKLESRKNLTSNCVLKILARRDLLYEDFVALPTI
jgi:hypothetical protein